MMAPLSECALSGNFVWSQNHPGMVCLVFQPETDPSDRIWMIQSQFDSIIRFVDRVQVGYDYD